MQLVKEILVATKLYYIKYIKLFWAQKCMFSKRKKFRPYEMFSPKNKQHCTYTITHIYFNKWAQPLLARRFSKNYTK